MKKLFKAIIPKMWTGFVKEGSQYNIQVIELNNVESEGMLVAPRLRIRFNNGMSKEIHRLGAGETIYFSAEVEEQKKYYLGTLVPQKLLKVKNTKPITKEEYLSSRK